MRGTRWAALFVPLLALCLANPSLAIPSKVDHVHNNIATTWKPPGAMNGPQHQHRDQHALDNSVQVVKKEGGIDFGL